MPISVTPTLSSSSGYLVDVRDQISNLIRFMIMNPGGTSDLWEGNLISFRYLSSRDEADRDRLCSTLKTTLSNILKRKFDDYNFDVEFYSDNYNSDNDGRYTIGFNINIINNGTQESALINGAILVDPKTNSIDLKYDKSIDNITFD